MASSLLSDWFVRLNNPSPVEMWENQPTYLLTNILYIFMAIMSLKFAVSHGWNSRYVYMWFAALLHGIVTEVVVYHHPDVNNFWHSQSFAIFVGQRFPLYIVLFYPATMTHAMIAAERLKLPLWAEPFAVGLFDVLLDFPYDIMGIKLLWWTWHDTDPNIFDRHYWVPWTSYFFHLSFHSSFALLLNGSRLLLTGNAGKKEPSGGFLVETLCVVITGCLSMTVAVLTQMLPLYHGLKDGFGLHSEVIMCIVFAIYIAIVYWYDRNPTDPTARQNARQGFSLGRWLKEESAVVVTIYYIYYAFLVYYARPENERSYGMHEPLGPASETVPQQAISGVTYTKQKYLDPANYDEGYFDFRCFEHQGVRGAPNLTQHPELVGEQWYTICGVPYESHAEYCTVVWSFCLIGFYAFYNAFSRSAAAPSKKVKRKRH